jgi:uncharacterized RDD family membrane protein YckC
MATWQKQLTIQTPEGIVFPLLIASPIARFLALAIDKGAVYVVSVTVSSLLGVLGVISMDLFGACSILSAFVISFGYPIVLEWTWRGQTLGKRLLRIQVIDEQGLRLQFSQVVVRNLLRFVDAIPAFYLVGGLACMVSRHGQRVGDLAANTVVVHHPRVAEPDLQQVLPDKYNSFRNYPHIAARLRQSVTPGLARVCVQALLRRDQLDDEARVALYRQIRSRLEPLSAFPPEALDGVSDERYVRNTVDIVYRQPEAGSSART